MRKFRYTGLEYVDMPRDQRPCYLTFTATDVTSGEEVVRIVTTKDFDGSFYWSNYDCCYHQDAGTCQFSVPSRSRDALRRYLKKRAEKTLNSEDLW